MTKPKVRNKDGTNWSALKAEFMTGNASLRALGRKYKIARGWLDQKTKGWTNERRQSRGKAVAESTQDFVDSYKKFSEGTKVALQNALDKANEILSGEKSQDGKKVIAPLRTADIVNIMNALQAGIKSFRLVEGRSTENVTVKHGYSRDYYMALIDFKSGNMPEIPEEFINQLTRPNIKRCKHCKHIINVE